MTKKKIFLLLQSLLLIIFIQATEADEQDPSLYPDFFYPYENSFFHLWANPAILAYNEKLQFHSSFNASLYTSLSAFYSLLNGDYALIAYWIDQFSAGGYGIGSSLDVGIEGKYWSIGLNTCINTFTRGPDFPEVSYGNCTFTASLYAGVAYPFNFNEIDLSIGLTFIPLYRLKVPMTTESYTTLLLNIMTWDQDKLKNLFKDISLYQGLGFGINSTMMLQYKYATFFLLLDNIFDTHIFYKKFNLGKVINDPALLLSSNNDSIDHVGRIPMDISLSGTYELSLPFKNIPNITFGCGIYHLLENINSDDSVFIDLMGLKSEIQIFSFITLLTAIYRGSCYINLVFTFASWEFDVSFFTAMNNRDNYPGPKEALTLGIYLFF